MVDGVSELIVRGRGCARFTDILAAPGLQGFCHGLRKRRVTDFIDIFRGTSSTTVSPRFA